ncbi:MAG: choice-of-anchor J domain-containing protein [Bacteroidia bacterium]|nr:choice-of-anchor J domain-containing protein [Bacteroidia bacterium]
MKNSTRIFIFLALVLSTYSGFASRLTGSQGPIDNGATQSFRSNPVPNKIQAAPFYSQDFSGGIPSGWQSVDNAGNGLFWKYTTTGIFNLGSHPGLDTLSSVGTTAANGYMILDSDSANGALPVDADLTSDAIDCSMYNVIHLRFNQLLYRFAESAKVFVSTDGTNWTEVYDASAGLSQGQATPNPDPVSIDITAYAALQSTVYIRFNYIGNYDYWWMIDDVELVEPAAADAGVFAITTPLTSCSILSATESVSVEIFNFGSDSISGFDVSYAVNGGTAVTENVPDTIAPGFSFTYTFAATADFSTPGSYDIQSYTALTGDADNTNDTVNSNIFNGATQVNIANSFAMGFEANEDFSRWSIEDANFDGNAWSLSTTLPRTGAVCARMATPNPGVVADDWLFTPCLELSDTVSYDLEFYFRNFSSSTESNLEVMIGSLPAAFGMTQSIMNPVSVLNLAYNQSTNNFTVAFPGVYYIGFHVTNADSTTNIRIDDIMLSGSAGVGINEINNSSIAVFPNPSNGMINLKSSGNTTKAEVIVLNPMGQVVYKNTFMNLQIENIDLTNLAEGQYTVRVLTDSGVNTQTFTIIR